MDATAAFLADAAQVHGGKIYAHGGGWDTIYAGSVPTAHPTMALVLLFRVEYGEASTDIPVEIELVDDDATSLGLRIEQKVNVGHAPGAKPGTPSFVPQALTFNMLSFPRHGGYQFRVTSDGEELAVVPFRVAPPPSPT